MIRRRKKINSSWFRIMYVRRKILLWINGNWIIEWFGIKVSRRMLMLRIIKSRIWGWKIIDENKIKKIIIKINGRWKKNKRY